MNFLDYFEPVKCTDYNGNEAGCCKMRKGGYPCYWREDEVCSTRGHPNADLTEITESCSRMSNRLSRYNELDDDDLEHFYDILRPSTNDLVQKVIKKMEKLTKKLSVLSRSRKIMDISTSETEELLEYLWFIKKLHFI